jgi:carbon-monoxide dehydrogenase medium subunit
VIPAHFDYERPDSIEEALELLADPEAKVLAGGHSLLPMMKLRLARPEKLVDIGRLEFRGVMQAAGELRIGALTTYDELLRFDGPLPDALREAAASVGDRQVRNAGTLGGALAHGDPGSDVAAAAIALDARLQLRSLDGTREVTADGFFLGPFTTGLEQQELLVEIVVPPPEPGEASAYASVDDPASGYPIAGAAARVRGDSWSVALTGVGAHPARLAGLGQGVPSVEAARVALGEPDAHDPDSDYRLELAAVVVARACGAAAARV